MPRQRGAGNPRGRACLGFGIVTPNIFGSPAEPFNASRLPWTKRVDLRLGKSLRAAGRDWELFADVRNILNFRNTRALFAETGQVVNDQYRTQLLAGEFASLRNEAVANGALLPGDAIDLSACGSWSGSQGPVNCVMLRRTEQRFGDGDGTYTLSEQTRALYGFYDAFFGSWRFYGSGRTVRIGARLEL